MEHLTKNAFIFGGSSGIGLSAAKLISKSGGNAAIFGRNESKLSEALDEIKAYSTGTNSNVSGYSLDVADEKQTSSLLNDLVEKLGAPDILINCAGFAKPARFEDISFEDFSRTLEVNLLGTRNTIYALLPFMKEKGGHIVNTSSVAGLFGVFGYSDYCASKFALIGFSQAIRSEFAKYNIRVSVLCPPDTDTPGLAAEDATKPAETKAIAAQGKILSPNQVADALIKGIEKNQFLILPGFDAKLLYKVNRLAPWLVEWIFDRAASKAGTK